MVCDQTNGNIVVIIFFVGLMTDLTHSVSQGTDRVYIKNGIYVLHNAGQTLQSHTGINIFIFQCLVVAVAVVLELGKYIVPDFHVTVTVAAYGTSRFSAAVFFSTVIIDLRAGAAGACTVLPEVIFFAKTEDSFRRNTDFLVPDIKSLIILQIYRRIQTVRIQSDNLCQKFPGPGNGFMFKVISEGEVAQHLKKCTVTSCFTYILDIAGTDAFLAGSHSSSRRDLSAGKIRF